MRAYWHIHHEALIERKIQPIGVRRTYIKEFKGAYEVKLRLRLLRLAKIPESLYPAVILRQYKNDEAEQLLKLHKEQCDPKCPWEMSDKYSFQFLWGNMFTHWDEKNNRYWLKED